MNRSSSNSTQSNFFSNRFNFDRSPQLLPGQAEDQSPLAFSPFQFDQTVNLLPMNFNSSPKFRRLDSEEGRAPEDRVVGPFTTGEGDKKFKPKLNPSVLLKRLEKGKSPKVTERAEAPTPDFKLMRGFPSFANLDPEDCQKSSQLAAESTVLESNLKSETLALAGKLDKLDDNRSILFSESEDEDLRVLRRPLAKGEKSDLRVTRLVKMSPLFHFFVRFYNSDAATPMDFEHRYELDIVKALMRHVGCRNVDALPPDNLVLGMCLQTYQRAPLRNRYLVTLALRMAARSLRVGFQRDHCHSQKAKPEVKALFRRHYFGAIADRFPEVLDCDLESHREVAALRKEQVSLILSAPAFSADFNKFLKSDFPLLLNSYRASKLRIIFSRAEEIFLSAKRQEDAVTEVTAWIGSKKFRWVCPTSSYVQAIDQARKG